MTENQDPKVQEIALQLLCAVIAARGPDIGGHLDVFVKRWAPECLKAARTFMRESNKRHSGE